MSCISLCSNGTYAAAKKISKIKDQLMAMADLMKPGSMVQSDDGFNELDEEETKILTEAGIISGSTNQKLRRKPKHIVFVENEEGFFPPFDNNTKANISLIQSRKT